jgi:uncharacterized membrane protein SpoIIM required for sporulation
MVNSFLWAGNLALWATTVAISLTALIQALAPQRRERLIAHLIQWISESLLGEIELETKAIARRNIAVALAPLLLATLISLIPWTEARLFLGAISVLPLTFLSAGILGVCFATLAAQLRQRQKSLRPLVVGTAPHGVLELPAIFLAHGCALSVVIGGATGPTPVLEVIIGSFIALLVAAVIEVEVTPVIAEAIERAGR